MSLDVFNVGIYLLLCFLLILFIVLLLRFLLSKDETKVKLVGFLLLSLFTDLFFIVCSEHCISKQYYIK